MLEKIEPVAESGVMTWRIIWATVHARVLERLFLALLIKKKSIFHYFLMNFLRSLLSPSLPFNGLSRDVTRRPQPQRQRFLRLREKDGRKSRDERESMCRVPNPIPYKCNACLFVLSSFITMTVGSYTFHIHANYTKNSYNFNQQMHATSSTRAWGMLSLPYVLCHTIDLA